jgi:hypothetical protein
MYLLHHCAQITVRVLQSEKWSAAYATLDEKRFDLIKIRDYISRSVLAWHLSPILAGCCSVVSLHGRGVLPPVYERQSTPERTRGGADTIMTGLLCPTAKVVQAFMEAPHGVHLHACGLPLRATGKPASQRDESVGHLQLCLSAVHAIDVCRGEQLASQHAKEIADYRGSSLALRALIGHFVSTLCSFMEHFVWF